MIHGRTTLQVLLFFAMALAVGAEMAPTNTFEKTNLPLLTQADDIRRLSPEQARLGYPVRLRGVVLDFARISFYHLFIHDGSASIYIDGATNRQYHFRPGEVIEVTGRSSEGEFAPMIALSNAVIVGKAKLPIPRDVTIEQITSGAEDGQWVRLRGIVHSATIQSRFKTEWPLLNLTTGGRRLNARINNYDGSQIDHLIDAEVTITGICTPLFNRKRQLVDLGLIVPGMEYLKIEKSAPEKPFDVPVRPINSLLQFVPTESHDHRVKVQGTVTLQQSSGSLFIKDKTQGLWVKTKQNLRVQPGDNLEVLGFPVVGEYTPVLEDAVFRKVGSGPVPEPVQLTVEQARKGDNDAGLIRVEAQLLGTVQDLHESVLMLQEKDFIFRAHLERDARARDFLSLLPGSRLQVTGICLAQLENQRWPQSFRMILRSPNDITVLKQPPWWTPTRVLWALAGMTAVFLGAMVWVITLRRQVHAQTQIIQSKAQREAVLEERTRIAREFHDTLQQELAGIGIQLDAVAAKFNEAPKMALQTLDLARSMVRRSQAETQRSVWDLRTSPLENGNLGTALSAMADNCKIGGRIQIEVQVSGNAYRLPTRIETHLLRIGQEATTNAVKHAAPKNIRIELGYEPQQLHFRVTDDGCGFHSDNATASNAGHFGLLGIRERADKLGATLIIASVPGKGTRIDLTIPVSNLMPESNAA